MLSKKSSLSIGLVLVHCIAIHVKSQVSSCTVFEYNAQGLGRRLRKPVIKESTASSVMDCIQGCRNKLCRCKSVNYGFSSKKCQLNNQTVFENGSNLIHDKDFTYIEKRKDENAYCTARRKELFCRLNGRTMNSAENIGTLCRKLRAAYRLNMINWIFNSTIFQGNQSFIHQLKHWLPSIITGLSLCYRATKDGWVANDFHSRCDNKGPTVTIVKVGKYIFGGYTDVSWGGSSRYINSTQSFMFSFVNKDCLKPFKAPIFRHTGFAIHTNPRFRPIFGRGPHLYIFNNANSNTDSFTYFGGTYKPPDGYKPGLSNTKALLAGSYKFSPTEMEVFTLR